MGICKSTWRCVEDAGHDGEHVGDRRGGGILPRVRWQHDGQVVDMIETDAAHLKARANAANSSSGRAMRQLDGNAVISSARPSDPFAR